MALHEIIGMQGYVFRADRTFDGFPAASVDPGRAREGGFGEVLDAVGENAKPASLAELSRQTHEWAIAAEQALRSA